MAGTLVVQTLQGPTSGANANKILLGSGQELYAPGHVVQVVQGSTTSKVTTTSATYTDTTLSASITPSSTSSKVLISVNQSLYNSGTANGNLRIVKDSTTLITQGYAPWDGVGFLSWVTFSYLDSPSTTSAITYKTTFARNSGSGDLIANFSSGAEDMTSYITVMEIAG